MEGALSDFWMISGNISGFVVFLVFLSVFVEAALEIYGTLRSISLQFLVPAGAIFQGGGTK